MIWNILWAVLIIVFLAAAFLFTVLPLIIPGIILTIIAALIFIFWKGLAALGVLNLIIILAMGICYLLADWLGGILGAAKFGASKFGVGGAIVGGLLGLPFGGLVGVLVGTVLGAALAEMVFERKKIKDSFRVGVGAALGFLLGTVGKIVAVAVATVVFLWAIWK